MKADDFPFGSFLRRGHGKAGLEGKRHAVLLHRRQDAAVRSGYIFRVRVLVVMADLITKPSGDTLKLMDHQIAQLVLIQSHFLYARSQAHHVLGKEAQRFFQLSFYQIRIQKLCKQMFDLHRIILVSFFITIIAQFFHRKKRKYERERVLGTAIY